jgi:methionyl aminopeptidase
MENKENRIKAGKIAADAREFGKTLCKEGAKYLDVAEKIEAKIEELGGKPAFPVNISVNDLAAHYTPNSDDESVMKKGDLVKIDVGAHIDGEIGDTAASVEIGTDKYEKLIKAAQEALDNAVKIVKPGVKLCEIGKIIQETIESHGYVPISNLSGHGVGVYDVHCKPTIPNYDNGDESILEEGDVVAIEPFATTGTGKVKTGKPSGIYGLSDVKPVRLQSVKKVLEYIINNFKTMPFCARWIRLPNVNFALRVLEKEGIIRQYEELPEESKGIVSQAEHTLIVGHGVIT